MLYRISRCLLWPMAPNNPTLNQDDDQYSGCTEQMDVFRRCSISFAIKVSVECISPSLLEQWRPDASSLGETHTQTGGRHQRGQRFVKTTMKTTTSKTTKMNCAPPLGETLVMTWHECGSGNLTRETRTQTGDGIKESQVPKIFVL